MNLKPVIQLLLQIWHIRERRDYHQKNSVTGIIIGCRYETSKGLTRAFQVALVVKNPPAHARDTRDARLILGVGKIPWRRAWQPTPVFLPGEHHGQRSLVGYSPEVAKSRTGLK